MTEAGDSQEFSISNLRDHPEFFDTVAHRIWDFTWRSEGFSLEHVSDGLRKLIANDDFPFAIVAHNGKGYLGSTLGIVSDLDERPQCTPWVGAVWVEPDHRKRNVGRSLVAHAAQTCFVKGFQQIYLCARTARRNFYVLQGWIPLERDVGKHRQTVFTMYKDGSSVTSSDTDFRKVERECGSDR